MNYPLALMVSFAALVAIAGCGSGLATPPAASAEPAPAPAPAPAAPAIIHCDFSSSFFGACEEHPASKRDLKDKCDTIGGTYGEGPCPTAGRIGHCECATARCAEVGTHPMYLYAPAIQTDAQGQQTCGQLRFVRD